MGVELKAKTNNGSFDDPRGLGANTSDVRFGSPISINEIVFAARREPVAKRVVVDVAFDVMAKGFKVEKEAKTPDPEWSRRVSKVKEILGCFGYPYNRRIAGAHGHFTMED